MSTFNKNLPECISCGEQYFTERWSLGYRTCLLCGEEASVVARRDWTVAPMHKSNYMLITDRADLLGINNKGGLVK